MEIEVVWRAFLITWVNIAPYITFTNTKGLLQLFGKIRSLSFELWECCIFGAITWREKFLPEMFAFKPLI